MYSKYVCSRGRGRDMRTFLTEYSENSLGADVGIIVYKSFRAPSLLEFLPNLSECQN